MHACTLVQHFLCQSCILNTLTLQSSISILLYLHYQHTINIKCMMTRIATNLQLRLHGIPNHKEDAISIVQNQLVYSSFLVQFHHDILMFDSINPLPWNSCALRMRLMKCCNLLTPRRPCMHGRDGKSYGLCLNSVLLYKHVYNSLNNSCMNSSPTFSVLYAKHTYTLQPSISILLYLI